MTDYDSSIITARSKQGVASMVAYLPDCLLVMPVQRWKIHWLQTPAVSTIACSDRRYFCFYMALNFGDFHCVTSCLSQSLGWDSPLPDDFVRFIGEVHIKPAQPLVIAPNYQIVSWKWAWYISQHKGRTLQTLKQCSPWGCMSILEIHFTPEWSFFVSSCLVRL